MNQRISEIKNLISEDSRDPFLYYALALEYVKIQNPEGAHENYDILINEFPEYLPFYYHAAHFYWEKNDLETARKIFEKGLELAASKNEQKTLLELQNAYNNFIIDLDEI